MMRDGFEAGPELLQKVLPLDGGLDLVSPKLLVEPGRLVDCLNYECADQVGYKKIDGFERYDGGQTPSVTTGYYFLLPVDAYPTRNDLFDDLNIVTSAGVQIEFGGALGADDPRVHATITRINQATVTGGTATADLYWKIYMETDNSEGMDTGIAAITLLNPDVVMYDADYTVFWSVAKIDDMARVDEEANLSLSIAVADTTRAEVDGLPGDVFPYGLQMYKDRMHVVANCQYIYLAFDTTSTVTVPTTVHYLRIGSNLSAGTYTAEILDWKFLRGANFETLGTTSGDRAWLKVLVYPTSTGTFSEGDDCFLDTTGGGVSGTNYWSAYSSLSGVTGAPTDSEEVWGGVLYKGLTDGSARTTSNDWTQIPMGYEVHFNGGNSATVPKELTRATTQAQLDLELKTVTSVPAKHATDSFASITGGYQNELDLGTGSADELGLDSATYSLSADDATGVFATYFGSNRAWGTPGQPMTFKNFELDIPSDAIVRAVRFTGKIWHKNVSPTLAVPITRVELVGVTGAFPIHNPLTIAAGATSGSPQSVSFQGGNGKWGLPEITPAMLNTADFGVAISAYQISNLGGFIQYMMYDTFQVEVDYVIPTGELVFYDATSTEEIETKLVRIHLKKGSWAAGDAEGVAHIYDPVLLDTTSPSRNYIKVGDSLRLLSGGTNIGTVTDVKASFLPSHADLIAADSMFQTLTANFYLNPEWEGIYGCHGLGHAFSYDGTYFRKIYSAYDSSLDKPRHICSYRNYLALGYPSGNVLLSKYGESGPEPENFDPLQGAREFSFVDKVVGLKELADTSLGVFCRSKINRIVLNPNAPSSSGLFYTAVVAADSGAIEYTVDNFGNMTLYCDQYGIRSVEQTDLLGGFIGRPMSDIVSPWLRPRLSAKKYWLNSRIAQTPLFAHTIRAKNQYRIWFTDGYVLCMNVNDVNSAPRFTLLRYALDFGSSVLPLMPIAYTSTIDTVGSERIHVAHWDRSASAASGENSPDKFKYVFELEKGWSFDGQDFPARLTMNLSFLDTPFDYDQIRKIELHAVDYNNTTLFAGFGTKYGEEGSYTGMALGSTFVPAGRNAAAAVAVDYVPFSKMINVASRGRPLYLKLKNSSTATGDTSASAIEPPHILQALLVQYTPARQET